MNLKTKIKAKGNMGDIDIALSDIVNYVMRLVSSEINQINIPDIDAYERYEVDELLQGKLDSQDIQQYVKSEILRSVISDINAKLSVIESDVSGNQKTIGAVNNRVTALSASLQSFVAENNLQHEAIKKRIPSLQGLALKSDLDTQILKIKNQILNEVERMLENLSTGHRTTILAGGGSGGGGGHVIQDEGTPLAQRANLNFVGAGVTATDDAVNDATVITIPTPTLQQVLTAGNTSTINIDLSTNTKLLLGAVGEIYTDGTDLIINPVSGIASIGIPSAGGGTKDLVANFMALAGSPISATSIINVNVVGSARAALSFTMDYTGTATAFGPVAVTSTDNGTSATAFNHINFTSSQQTQTNAHATINQYGYRADMGIQNTVAITTAGNKTIVAFHARLSQNGRSSAGTNAGDFVRVGFLQSTTNAIQGSPTSSITLGAHFNNDVQLVSGIKIILDGAAGDPTNAGLGTNSLSYNSTQKGLLLTMNGIAQQATAAIFSQTANATVANTTTETSVIGTGVGTKTLPANFLVVGKTVELRGSGIFSTALVPGNVTLKFKLGSNSIASATITTMPGSAGNVEFNYCLMVTCRTTGATGTVMAGGGLFYFTKAGTEEFAPLNNAGTTTTIDTTATQAVDLTWQWATASASNTATGTICTMESLN